MKYKACRRCGVPLYGSTDTQDGLCSKSADVGSVGALGGHCYYIFRNWMLARPGREHRPPVGVFNDPGSLVLIDEWLEKGCP